MHPGMTQRLSSTIGWRSRKGLTSCHPIVFDASGGKVNWKFLFFIWLIRNFVGLLSTSSRSWTEKCLTRCPRVWRNLPSQNVLCWTGRGDTLCKSLIFCCTQHLLVLTKILLCIVTKRWLVPAQPQIISGGCLIFYCNGSHTRLPRFCNWTNFWF